MTPPPAITTSNSGLIPAQERTRALLGSYRGVSEAVAAILRAAISISYRPLRTYWSVQPCACAT